MNRFSTLRFSVSSAVLPPRSPSTRLLRPMGNVYGTDARRRGPEPQKRQTCTVSQHSDSYVYLCTLFSFEGRRTYGPSRRFLSVTASNSRIVCVPFSISMGKCGVVLTPQLAKEIYTHKLAFQTPTNFGSCFEAPSSMLKGKSSEIAKLYNVSPKTVRDIWNRKTWTFATCDLWKKDISQFERGKTFSKVIETFDCVLYSLGI